MKGTKILVGAFAAVLLLAIVGCTGTAADNSDPIKELVERSTPTTETISDDSQWISSYWYKSGAVDRGYSLDAYKAAIQSLNPSASLDPVHVGDKFLMPMNIKPAK